jgi:hypothetical protein
MRRVAAVLSGVGALWAGAANATGSFECTATDVPDVMASVLVARLPNAMVMPLRAQFLVGDDTWATAPEEGVTPIKGAITVVTAHQYGDAHNVILEYADEDATGVLISLRLVRGAAADWSALAGVLTVRDVGAWAVTCLEG